MKKKNISQTDIDLYSIKHGDMMAENRLFARYWPRIRRWIHAKGLPREIEFESADISQDICIKVWSQFKDTIPSNRQEFRTWLYRKIRDHIKNIYDFTNALKRKAPEGTISLDLLYDMDNGDRRLADKRGLTPRSIIDISQLMHIIFSKFTEDEQKIIQLRLEEFTFSEIGVKIGMSEDAARKKYGRAITKLRSIVM